MSVKVLVTAAYISTLVIQYELGVHTHEEAPNVEKHQSATLIQLRSTNGIRSISIKANWIVPGNEISAFETQ